MADEDKLVKAGVEAALKPFADLLDKLAGPAAEEIGLTLKDHVRVFRLKRQIRLFERVKEMLKESGIRVCPLLSRGSHPPRAEERHALLSTTAEPH